MSKSLFSHFVFCFNMFYSYHYRIFTAERHFRNALKSVIYSSQARERISLRYLSLFNNLGHVLRKLGKYNECLEMHQKVLSLAPNYIQAHLALGFVYAYKSEWALAMKHLDLMFEQHILGKELNSITENLLDNHVLKHYSDADYLKDDPDRLEEPFADKELVDRLSNQAPIDVLKAIRIARKKEISNCMNSSV